MCSGARLYKFIPGQPSVLRPGLLSYLNWRRWVEGGLYSGFVARQLTVSISMRPGHPQGHGGVEFIQPGTVPDQNASSRNLGTACSGEPGSELVEDGRTRVRSVSAGHRTLAFMAESRIHGVRLPRLRGRCARGPAVGLVAHL